MVLADEYRMQREWLMEKMMEDFFLLVEVILGGMPFGSALPSPVSPSIRPVAVFFGGVQPPPSPAHVRERRE